ncbi:hypothetical protein MTO96_007635 [Rhipicephalus appendiculatus]
MAFRNASHNDALLVKSIQGMTAGDEESGDSLTKMAVDITQTSQVTKQTVSEVERSRVGHVSLIADVKKCKESLCAELDEIERATDQLRSCEAADQQEMREHEDCAEKLHSLMAEMRGRVEGPSEGELKDLEGIREGVRDVVSAFRNATHNDVLLLQSLQGMTAKDEQHVNPLLRFAAEVEQMSHVTRHTVSEVERSRDVSLIADVKKCKESLCSELNKIERATNELRPCEAADQQEMREA